MREEAIGYLLDAFEPDEMDRLEERVVTDPEFAAEVERCRAIVRPLSEDDCIEAPPGLAARTLEATQGQLAAQRRDTAEWSASGHRWRAVDVVVACSVVLLACTLVIPAITNLRGDQDRLACAEHLRRLGMAMAVYAEFEAEHLPYVAPDGPTNHAGVFALSLKARDLLPDTESLLCPASNSAVVLLPEPQDYLSEDQDAIRRERWRRFMGGSYGYALGYRVGDEHRGLSLSEPSRPVLSDRPPRAQEANFINSPNHGGRGQNVLFSDGHVRWLPTPIFATDHLFHNDCRDVGAGIGPDDSVLGVSEATPYRLGARQL